MLQLLCQQGHREPSACNRTKITCVTLQAIIEVTILPITATVVPESRFCLHAIEGRARVQRRPVERRFPDAFAHDTQALCQARGVQEGTAQAGTVRGSSMWLPSRGSEIALVL